MIKVGVRVDNISGFDAQFEELVAAIESRVKEVAEDVRDNAKSTAAFIDRTGNLRRSIRMRKKRNQDGVYQVLAYGSNRDSAKGYHAALVEFGHVMIAWGHPTGKRVAAKPYMRPAIEKGYQKAVQLFRSKK